MALDAKARDQVIRTILGEAADQGPQGWAAVANVIKNRTDSGAWGDPLKGGVSRVIYAPKQFSAWNPGNKAGVFANTVSANDPRYQRVGQVADAVFSETVPDNTGGATHYYAPSGMPGGQPPDWAVGQQGKQIGTQNFYRLPLTAANTAGTAISTPSSVQSNDDAQSARAYLSTLSAHTDRAGDTANLNPEFATRLAAAVKQARAEGLPVSVMSAFREGNVTGSAYDMGGNSSHTYGLASDIAGLDGPNGKITQRWAQIAAANGLHNPYGVGDAAEFNHWQLPERPLEQTPTLLASLKAAKASGDMSKVWSAFSFPDATVVGSPSIVPAGPPEEVEPNKPAPLAQPVAAAALPPGTPAAAAAQNPSASLPGPNARFQVLQGMTTGGGGQAGRNAPLITALNLAPGAGSAPPATGAGAAAAPAAAPQATPLDQSPMPPPRSPGLGIGVNQGVLAANPPTPPVRPPDLGLNQGALTANPPMPPPKPADLSMMQNPLFASAQNLLKLLYPTG
jgi:hypothetical protein